MKTKFSIVAFICFILAGVMSSCSNDDSKYTINATPEVQKAFKLQYPNAKNTKWEIRNSYYVAEFNDDGYRSVDAWYNASGEWFLSEYDVAYDAVPAVVKTTFMNSLYGAWKVDDVDLISRPSFMDLYIIEAEEPATDREVDVYISADGVYIKAVLDSDDNLAQPIIIPAAIKEFITATYPDASIIDIDQETNGNYEVDIIDNKKTSEVVFDSKFNWLYTDSDVLMSAVPQVVIDAVNAKFAGYSIDDDVTLRTMPTPPNQYIFELEKEGAADITAIFDANGTFIK